MDSDLVWISGYFQILVEFGFEFGQWDSGFGFDYYSIRLEFSPFTHLVDMEMKAASKISSKYIRCCDDSQWIKRRYIYIRCYLVRQILDLHVIDKIDLTKVNKYMDINCFIIPSMKLLSLVLVFKFNRLCYQQTLASSQFVPATPGLLAKWSCASW